MRSGFLLDASGAFQYSSILGFPQNTLCVLWREKRSAVQQIHNPNLRKQLHRPHSRSRKEQSQQAQTEAQQAHTPKSQKESHNTLHLRRGLKSSKTSLDRRSKHLLLISTLSVSPSTSLFPLLLSSFSSASSFSLFLSSFLRSVSSAANC